MSIPRSPDGHFYERGAVNGNVPGRLADHVPVSIGADSVPISISIGLNMENDQAEALRGQSFLSRFDVSMEKDRMVLRNR